MFILAMLPPPSNPWLPLDRIQWEGAMSAKCDVHAIIRPIKVLPDEERALIGPGPSRRVRVYRISVRIVDGPGLKKDQIVTVVMPEWDRSPGLDSVDPSKKQFLIGVDPTDGNFTLDKLGPTASIWPKFKSLPNEVEA